MYFSAPRWRGTSAVVDLRSAQKIRGLGLVDYTQVDPSGSTPCSEVLVPAGFKGAVNCDNSAGGSLVYGASQAQLASLQASIQEQIAQMQSSSPPWGTIALIGGGGLLLVVLLKALR